MYIAKIIAELEKGGALSLDFREFIRKKCTVIFPKKDEYILQENHNKQVFIFVAEGLIYSMHGQDSGEKIASMIAIENQIISTFIYPYPDVIQESVIAGENCVLVTWSYDDILEACTLFSEADNRIKTPMAENLRTQRKFTVVLRHRNCTIRKNEFEEKFPEIYKRASTVLLSKLIGMARSYLSGIKNEHYNKKKKTPLITY